MSDQKHHELIIVRRHEEEEHEAHSSAWKVAHADFMTAMMAFFLIMWLINVTDEEVKRSIANYFNPVKLSSSITNRKGLNDEGMVTPKGPKSQGDQTSAGPVISETPSEHAANPEHSGSVAVAAAGTAAGDGKKSGSASAAEGHAADDAAHLAEAAEHSAAEAAATAEAAPSASAAAEQAAFSNPYAALARLASDAPKPEPQSTDVPVGADGAAGVEGGDVSRDPFDPIYWQMEAAHEAVAAAPRPAATAESVPTDGRPDAIAARDEDQPRSTSSIASPTKPTDPASPTPPAELVSLQSPTGSAASPPSAVATAAAAVQEQAAEVKTELTAALNQSVGAADAPHIEVQATSEGILISLTDDIHFSMFDVGSAIPKPVVVVAMDRVADVLSRRAGSIVVRGHTDGRPFHSDTYDNWRLSTARAHMAYYMLTRGRLSESRIVRIEGFADRELKNPQDPNAAENRRIEVLLQEPTA